MRRNTKLGAYDVYRIIIRALTRTLALFAVLEVLTGVSVERVLLHHPLAFVCIAASLAMAYDVMDLLPDRAFTRRKGHGERSCRRRP